MDSSGWNEEREDAQDPDACGGGPDAGPQRRVRAALARELHAAVADVVQQDHRPDPRGMGRHIGLGPAQGVAVEVRRRRLRRLLAVEQHEADRRRAGRTRRVRQGANWLGRESDQAESVAASDSCASATV